MPSSKEFKVHGLKELSEKLEELGSTIEKRLVRRALAKAGEPIRAEVQKGVRRAAGGPTYTEHYVPKSKRAGGARGPGHVADHINAQVTITKNHGAVVRVGPDPDHWYLSFQEFGTSKAPAQPVLRPALQSQSENAIEIFKNDLGEGIEREAKRIARRKAKVP